MVVHNDARPALDLIDQLMKLKEVSVGDHDIYLIRKLKNVRMSKYVWCWSLSPPKYEQEAIRNYKNHQKDNYSGEYEFNTNPPNPFPLCYEPDMDVSPMMSPDEASYYQTIIGVMRWMVELGCVDIAVEVSLISLFVAMPHKSHMVSALQIMSYLRIRHNY